MISLTILLVGCHKDELPKQCNCGIVLEKYMSSKSLFISDPCGYNDSIVVVTKEYWVNAQVGDQYCLPEGQKW